MARSFFRQAPHPQVLPGFYYLLTEEGPLFGPLWYAASNREELHGTVCWFDRSAYVSGAYILLLAFLVRHEWAVHRREQRAQYHAERAEKAAKEARAKQRWWLRCQKCWQEFYTADETAKQCPTCTEGIDWKPAAPLIPWSREPNVTDDVGGLTLLEVGGHLKVTRERIRQIEAKALRKLRHPSRSKWLRPFVEDAGRPEACDEFHEARIFLNDVVGFTPPSDWDETPSFGWAQASAAAFRASVTRIRTAGEEERRGRRLAAERESKWDF